jgi:lipopolysaccharide transport system ATP-binding protein
VWSLKDINFEIQQGDVLGIVGKNGAGKSTLLKILSRVTAPTTGNIKVRGRIASLLEVGTGFHPELTGRENIFLNGAILGMRKHEIKSKFDEIIDFAGVERFIDTPVKRYSSGMYVRLAFAVAAHLEPEILIIDEVLAVGDAEFQKKCLGKMKDVSGTGRTVLFVSHNLTAVQTLCNKGILIENGTLTESGFIQQVVEKYNTIEQKFLQSKINFDEFNNYQSEIINPIKFEISQEKNQSNGILNYTDDFSISFHFENKLDNALINLSFVLKTSMGEIVFNSTSEPKYLTKGFFTETINFPKQFLNQMQYTFDLYFIQNQSISILKIESPFSFEIKMPQRDDKWYGDWIGSIHPQLKWNNNEI